MLLKLLFLVIFIQVIFGKEEATLGEFPWTVSLRLFGFVGHDCGGAILNPVKIFKSNFVAKVVLTHTIRKLKGRQPVRFTKIVAKMRICCYGSAATFIVANVRKCQTEAQTERLIYFELW